MFSVEITSNKMFKRTHFKQNNEFGAAATAAAAQAQAQAPAIVVTTTNERIYTVFIPYTASMRIKMLRIRFIDQEKEMQNYKRNKIKEMKKKTPTKYNNSNAVYRLL